MRRTFVSASFFCTFAVGIVILFFHEFFSVQSFALNGFFCYICNVIVILRLICLVRFWI